MWIWLKKAPPMVTLVFTLAGFASAYVGSDYSAWVKSMYAANNQLALASKCIKDCQATNQDRHFDCIGTCESSAHEAWYRQNIALSEYADRQWWIWGLTFPAAMTLAIIVTLGWLTNTDPARAFQGVGLLFVASAVAATLTIAFALLWVLAFLPAAAGYAFLLARISAFMTSAGSGAKGSRKSIFLLLLLCIPIGAIVGGILELVLPTFSWFAGIEIAWAFVFGASLGMPAD